MRDLCIRVGLPYQTLLNQRSQNRYPGIPVVLVLAHELKCSIDWLVFGDEVKQEDNDAYLKLIQKKEIIDRIVMSDSTDLLDYLENVLTAE